MASKEDQQKALADLIASTLALLERFVSSLGATEASATIANPPNPLNVLHDSALLLKAHTTKLSLLAINKPFTPSAVTTVLRELSTTCLPAMISANQILTQEKATWGAFAGKEAELRTRRVFKEMEMLLQEVRAISQGDSSVVSRRRDSLASTGVVWESCDALAELKGLGIAGLAVQKAEQWRETIKDAITELHEWMEGEDLDTEGQKDALLDSDDEAVAGDTDSLDDVFNAANSMPQDRPELKRLVEEAMGKLKKITLLYAALGKRRLKTFKMEDTAVSGGELAGAERLDRLMDALKKIPHQVDDLASAFYDLEEEAVREQLKGCVDEAKLASETAKMSWDGREDEFSAWRLKWLDAIGAEVATEKS
ncbi:hypothetical protein MBLNU230_g4234t1 [Neophaeotheca triangularis]